MATPTPSEKTRYADKLSPDVRRVVLDQPRWLRRWPNLVRLLVGVPALARYLRVQQPDIVLAAGDRVHLPSMIAWQISGRPMSGC